jgi:STE24 endopeptidase
VLFDTLFEALRVPQVVAVFAHELGHFKLHHVRWNFVRGTALTGLSLYLLSLCVDFVPFYEAFSLAGRSFYGALVVFGAWFGLADFVLGPLGNALSRRHEFAADAFAVQHLGSGQDLAEGLLRLREKSHSLPLSDPLFSWVYHSHPPILERLQALEGSGAGQPVQ